MGRRVWPARGAVPERLSPLGETDGMPMYGLAVTGAGLVAYVEPAFEVGASPVEIVVEAVSAEPRGKVAAGEILGDVNNDELVTLADVLLVMMYSLDASLTLPNDSNISLGGCEWGWTG